MTDAKYVGDELEIFAHAVNWKKYVALQLRPWIRGDVLEVGAGIGATTTALVHEGVTSWTALEPDRELAQLALPAVERAEPPLITVTVGTIEDLDPRPAYDTILYVDVLEHIEDDVSELGRAVERLRPGGRLVVLAPAHQWLFTAFDQRIGHFRRYDRRLVTVAPNELRLDRCWYLDSAGLLVTVANRLLLRSATPTPTQVKFWDRVLIPLSRRTDPVLRNRVGKSIVVVWSHDGATTGAGT